MPLIFVYYVLNKDSCTLLTYLKNKKKNNVPTNNNKDRVQIIGKKYIRILKF